ncbi:urease accessory protein UreD [Methylorubrum extorquens]|uniref:Urease accessory protein UreD n=2 Tax=Methylorubrum extorquens TaxID=408 RepID=C5AWW9_METEA|nr:urease accessory protein UreD [Methylorubrum extorquens]ACS40974.1 Urease accessory protein UreD [Methylorubrum extorquens AM1]EHP92499.1 Urease accessory protein ureD [Methylorubrum extorquens DSM 13060]
MVPATLRTGVRVADEAGTRSAGGRPIPAAEPLRPALSRQRSQGAVHLRVAPAGTAADAPTRIVDLAESGPLRLRCPRRGAERMLEGVLVNTGGGIACGDVFTVSVTVEPGGACVLTTTAAEKIYRSDGPCAEIVNRVSVGAGGRLDWLPQETILFDRARLVRRFEAELAPDASLLVAEIAVLGRAARGESLEEALFEDRWRIRRDGRLVYADSLRLDGAVTALMDRRAIGGGARALATILDLSPRAEGRLDEARALLDTLPAQVEAGASAWNGHLAVRMLAPTVAPLRDAAARFLAAWRGQPMPRVWQT